MERCFLCWWPAVSDWVGAVVWLSSCARFMRNPWRWWGPEHLLCRMPSSHPPAGQLCCPDSATVPQKPHELLDLELAKQNQSGSEKKQQHCPVGSWLGSDWLGWFFSLPAWLWGELLNLLMLWFSCLFVHGLMWAVDVHAERSGGELEAASSSQTVLLWSSN